VGYNPQRNKQNIQNKNNILQPRESSTTGLILPKNKVTKKVAPSQKSKKNLKGQVYSEQFLNASVGLENQLENNLQSLIDYQIELDLK